MKKFQAGGLPTAVDVSGIRRGGRNYAGRDDTGVYAPGPSAYGPGMSGEAMEQEASDYLEALEASEAKKIQQILDKEAKEASFDLDRKQWDLDDEIDALALENYLRSNGELYEAQGVYYARDPNTGQLITLRNNPLERGGFDPLNRSDRAQADSLFNWQFDAINNAGNTARRYTPQCGSGYMVDPNNPLQCTLDPNANKSSPSGPQCGSGYMVDPNNPLECIIDPNADGTPITGPVNKGDEPVNGGDNPNGKICPTGYRFDKNTETCVPMPIGNLNDPQNEESLWPNFGLTFTAEQPSAPTAPSAPSAPFNASRTVSTEKGGLADIKYLYDVGGDSIFAPTEQNNGILDDIQKLLK